MFEVLTPIVAGIAGAGVAVAIYRLRSRQTLEQARQQAGVLEEESLRDAEALRQAAEGECSVAVRAFEQSAALDQQQSEADNRRLSQLVERKAARIAQHEEQARGRKSRLDQRWERVRQLRKESKEIREAVKDCRARQQPTLESRAAETRARIRERLVEAMVDESKSRCADRLRNLESSGNEAFGREAKRVMGIVMQRYTGHCMRERTSTNMPLEAGWSEKLQGDAAPDVALLSSISGVKFAFADDGNAVRLESGDGVARELCRRVLTRLAGNRPIRDAGRMIESMRVDLEKEIQRTGRQAFKQLALDVADPEIVDLVGKLNFRTSYTQNQWKHSIEAGHLAGMMAGELGLEPAVARRGALMHDIGKALTHQVEGSHALIGAEIARRTGEDERVANAIGFHHGEEPCGSAYSPLVAAADAMSGGRPGARREMVESYGDRIGDLERIASGFGGVSSVHAVQAGRELRVHVDQAQVGEHELDRLSELIAQKISDQMTFPGQIRVTVIREFTAVATAT